MDFCPSPYSNVPAKDSLRPTEGLLNSANLSGPKFWTAKKEQKSRCALLTCTSEGSVGLQVMEGDELTAHECGSNSSDRGEPSIQWQRTTPQPERLRQRQSLVSLMVESTRQHQSTSEKGISDAPPFNFQQNQVLCSRWDLPADLSPSMTRRNMLATELTESTESLRLAIMLEWQHGALKVDTDLSCRYISQISGFSGQSSTKFCMKTSENANAQFWNLSLIEEVSRNHYHSKGW